jgi:hypothetical protein
VFYACSVSGTIQLLLTDLPGAGAGDKFTAAYMQAVAEVAATHWSKLLVSNILGSSVGGTGTR